MAFDFEQYLHDTMQPLSDYAHGQTALTLAQIGRQQKVADTQQEQEFQLKRDAGVGDRQQKYLETMLKNQKEAEDAKLRLALLGQAAKLKVKVDKGASNEDIISAIADQSNANDTKDAKNTITFMDGLRKRSESDLKDAQEEFSNLLSSRGTIDQKRQALQQAMTDPSMLDLTKPQLAKVKAAAFGTVDPDTGRVPDPDKVISEITGQVAGENWFPFTANKWAKKANAIQTAYQTPLLSTLATDYKERGAFLASKIAGLTKDVKDARLGLSTAAIKFGKDLPDDMVEKYSDPDFAEKDATSAQIGQQIFDLFKQKVNGAPAPVANTDPIASFMGSKSKPTPTVAPVTTPPLSSFSQPVTSDPSEVGVVGGALEKLSNAMKTPGRFDTGALYGAGALPPDRGGSMPQYGALPDAVMDTAFGTPSGQAAAPPTLADLATARSTRDSRMAGVPQPPGVPAVNGGQPNPLVNLIKQRALASVDMNRRFNKPMIVLPHTPEELEAVKQASEKLFPEQAGKFSNLTEDMVSATGPVGISMFNQVLSFVRGTGNATAQPVEMTATQ